MGDDINLPLKHFKKAWVSRCISSGGETMDCFEKKSEVSVEQAINVVHYNSSQIIKLNRNTPNEGGELGNYANINKRTRGNVLGKIIITAKPVPLKRIHAVYDTYQLLICEDVTFEDVMA